MQEVDPATLTAKQQWERDRQIVLAQLHNLMLALRSNAKFSSKVRFVQAAKEPQHRLTLLVKELRESLFSPLSQTECVSEKRILTPFCEVALSEETTEPITGVALAAFVTFLDLKCSFLTEESLVRISDCASHSKSEIADAQSHEAVLARILQVYVGCARHPAAHALSEEHIVGMIQRAYAVSTHGEPSELLRRTAEQAMNDIVTAIFYRIVNEPRKGAEQQQQHEGGGGGGGQSDSGVKLVQYICKLVLCDVEIPRSSDASASHSMSVAAVQLQGLCLAHTALFILKDFLRQPSCAGLLHCVRNDLCRALLSVGSHSDNIIVMSQLLRTAHLVVQFASVEVIPQTLAIIKGIHLTPMLPMIGLTSPTQISSTPKLPRTDSSANFPAASASPTMDELDLRETHEMLMESLLEFCSDSAFPTFCFAHYDLSLHYPALFESLCRFLAKHCHHLHERSPRGGGGSNAAAMSSSNAANASGTGAGGSGGLVSNASHGNLLVGSDAAFMGHINQINILALESLIAMLNTLVERVSNGDVHSSKAADVKAAVEERFAKKQRLQKFAELFAKDPVKEGVKYLRAPAAGCKAGCFGIASDCSGWEIGEFLFQHKSILDKTILGDYLGELGKEPLKPDPAEDIDGSKLRQWENDRSEDYKIAGTTRFCEVQLRGFLNCFNFRGKTLLNSVREMVYQMRLPGEAQKIDRVMQAFATQWYSLNKDSPTTVNPFLSEDAAFILSFSIIMLNTDLHSGKLERRMTQDQFRSMNRGIDNGNNLPDEYLNAVYDDISSNRIVMIDMVKEAHENDSAWRLALAEEANEESYVRGDRISQFLTHLGMRGQSSDDLFAFDPFVFATLWRPCVNAFSVVIEMSGASFVVDKLSNTVEQMNYHLKKRHAREFSVFCSALKGVTLIAQPAHKLGNSEAVDSVFLSLLQQIKLASLRDGYTQLLSIGRSPSALNCLQHFFQVLQAHSNVVVEAWANIAVLLQRLFMFGVFSPFFAVPREENEATATTSSTAEAAAAVVTADDDSNAAAAAKRERTPQPQRSETSPLSETLMSNPGIVGSPAMRHRQSETGSWLAGFWGSSAANEAKRKEKEQEEAACLRRVKSACPSSLTGLLHASQSLPDSAFVALVKALISAGTMHSVTASEGFAASYTIHLTLEFVNRNIRRFDLVKPLVFEHIRSVMTATFGALSHPIDVNMATTGMWADIPVTGKPVSRQVHEYWKGLSTRTVEAVLRLVSVLSHDASDHAAMFELLSSITALPAHIFSGIVAQPLSVTLWKLVCHGTHPFELSTPLVWEHFLQTVHGIGLAAPFCEVRARAVAVLTAVARDGKYFVPDNSRSLARALTSIVLAAPVTTTECPREEGWTTITQFDANPLVALATPVRKEEQSVDPKQDERAAEALTELHRRLTAQLSTASNSGGAAAPPEVWLQAWYTVIGSLCAFVVSSKQAKIASDALLCLQRCILDPRLMALPVPYIYDIFASIVFPLCEQVCCASLRHTIGGENATGAASSSDASQGGAALAKAGGTGGSALSLFSPSVLISTMFGPLAGPEQQQGHHGQQQPTSSLPSDSKQGVVVVPAMSNASSFASNPSVSEEMQCRAISLLPKSFLQYVAVLASAEQGLLELWRRMLGTLYALYSQSCGTTATTTAHASGPKLSGTVSSPGVFVKPDDISMLREAIQESVKNMVFVLTSNLSQPENANMLRNYPKFWPLTKELLRPFDFSEGLIAHLESCSFLQ